MNPIVNSVWHTLPLKKRPIKEEEEDNEGLKPNRLNDQIRIKFENYYDQCEHGYFPFMKKHCSRSSSPVNSEFSINSIDSGFVDHNSPLDLSSPSSRRSSTSNVFNFDENSIIAYKNQVCIVIRCKECNKQFTSKTRYQAHLRRHASKRSGRYTCPNCKKTFVQRSSLTTHLRIHTGERPFKCTECDDCFGDFSTYTKHKRIHSGEKPYVCPVCSRAFSQSGNMHRHLNTIHQNKQ